MRHYLYLSGIVILTSCGGGEEEAIQNQPATVAQAVIAPTPGNIIPADTKTAEAGVTPNEQNGLNEINAFYGGKCKYSSGRAKGGKKYFRIEVSQSGSLDSNVQITELSASNIAILFYKDLREERKDYGEIRSVIKFSGGQQVEKTYTTTQLETVLSKMMVVRQIALKLQDKKYDEIAGLLNDQTGIVKYNKQALIKKVKAAEPKLGNVKDFVPYGFVYIKTEQKKLVLHISGVLMRDTQNNEFSVDFDATSDKDEAIFLNYKL